MVPLQILTLNPHPDSSRVSEASHRSQRKLTPFPLSSSTSGINLKTPFHHSQDVICKDVRVQCIHTLHSLYYTCDVYNIQTLNIKKFEL